jgi:hypothetical protein
MAGIYPDLRDYDRVLGGTDIKGWRHAYHASTNFSPASLRAKH